MHRNIAILLGIILVLGTVLMASPARGEASMQDFQFEAERRASGVLVRVQYLHGLWGWVDVGHVDFQHTGTVVLSIRGEQPRAVADLSRALTTFFRDRSGAEAGHAVLGRQLAQVIQEHGALSP